MKYKIGVFGSAFNHDAEINKKTKSLGEELALHNVIIITGACSGMPYEVASEASKNGAEIWGYSPEFDLKNQKLFTPKDDLSIYKKIIYTPESFEFSSNGSVCKKYRNVISTANCDAGIIVGGRWGTMNEFTNLYDMGKIIGVFTGTGGIADEIENLSKKVSKQSKAKILFSDDPKKLVEEIMRECEERHSGEE